MDDTATYVTITYPTEQTELYCRYDGETAPQPVVLELDTEDGILRAAYRADRNAMPMSVFHRRVLWWDMPCLAADDARRLLDDVADDARSILAGASIEWDGNNHVGRYSADAREGIERIEAAIERYRDYDKVEEMDAADWYSTGEDPAGDLGITPNTDDDELSVIADRLENEIVAGSHGPTVVSGALQFVTQVRDDLRGAE